MVNNGSTGGGRNTTDMLTLAYDAATGATVWSRRFDGPVHGYDYGMAVAVSPDGSRVFATGISNGGPSLNYDIVTIAYNAGTGARLWLQRFDANAHSDDEPSSITVSPDGSKVFVTGYSTGASTSADYVTVAYDTSTGTRVWLERYAGYPGSGGDYAHAISVSPDGSKVFVTGESQQPSNGYAYVTIAYDAATGARLWLARYIPAASGHARAIGVSPDGSTVYVTGTVGLNTGTGPDYGTVAYDAASGAQKWLATYDAAGPGKNGSDQATALAVSPDGSRIYVTGESFGPHSTKAVDGDYATVAYSPSGAQLWVARYDDDNHNGDAATALAVTPDGTKVLVTGLANNDGTFGGRTVDYGTLAVNAVTGQRLWLRRNNGVGNGGDFAKALAVSPDSRTVVVTGYSEGNGTNPTGFDYDWSTIAYTSG
jgi:DNA-binding beta-propeller fold protein YncE